MRGQRINPHLVFSFNFTNLPQGRRRAQMTEALRQVDRFAVYSHLEKDLYADYFGIPPEKIDFLHFAVAPPRIEDSPELPVAQPYVCAIGSQGRDYALLFEAAQALPSVRFCVIAYQSSVAGLKVPPNVTVLQGVTFDFAAQVAANAEFMVLPLITAITRIEPNLIDASFALGGGHWRAFRKVLLPLSLPGILAGCMLTFAAAITAFISQSLIGGGQKLFMPMYIYQQASSLQNWPFASAISIIFLAAVLVAVWIFNQLGRLSRGISEA